MRGRDRQGEAPAQSLAGAAAGGIRAESWPGVNDYDDGGIKALAHESENTMTPIQLLIQILKLTVSGTWSLTVTCLHGTAAIDIAAELV